MDSKLPQADFFAHLSRCFSGFWQQVYPPAHILCVNNGPLCNNNNNNNHICCRGFKIKSPKNNERNVRFCLSSVFFWRSLAGYIMDLINMLQAESIRLLYSHCCMSATFTVYAQSRVYTSHSLNMAPPSSIIQRLSNILYILLYYNTFTPPPQKSIIFYKCAQINT